MNLNPNLFIYTFTLLFTSYLLCFCTPNDPSEITKEIEGKYEYNYPSGQVEVIGIKNDYTFSQAIYANAEDYKKGEPLHKNGGTWTYRGVQLEFDHWLEYCKHRNPDSILAKPYHSSMLNVTWYAPTEKHSGLINVFDENGYVFKKSQ